MESAGLADEAAELARQADVVINTAPPRVRSKLTLPGERSSPGRYNNLPGSIRQHLPDDLVNLTRICFTARLFHHLAYEKSK